MESTIEEFYKNKTIFVTGASGFLGKITTEKLLRSTKVKRIYVLFRAKRGIDIQSRIGNWKSDSVFSPLLQSNPRAFDRVIAIAGDCELSDLGICDEDRKLLVEEVHVVLHIAATVKFNETLSVAFNINTRATHLMLQLAKQMRHLQAFVHMSTAYSNCVIEHIKERFYPEHLTCSYDKILTITEQLSGDLIDKITPTLIGKYPNTYTFTKALAEQVVQNESDDLPVCIVRPGMIFPAYREPIKGWIDNLYGPISIIYAISVGVMHTVQLNLGARANIVPADYCINLSLTGAWQVSVEADRRREQGIAKPSIPTRIYNFAPSEQNPFRWADLEIMMERFRNLCPLEQAIWHPCVSFTRYTWLYNLEIYFYHLLPGFFIDLGLRLSGKKPRLMKVYKKMHKSVKMVARFGLTNWSFEMDNMVRLLDCMSPQDRKLFEFDINALGWEDYLKVSTFGMREYIAKEKPTEESIQRARKGNYRLLIYHRVLQFTLCCIAGAFVWWLLKLFI